MIAISLPEKLVKVLDREAIIRYETRSEYIKRAIIGRMQADGADITGVESRTYDEARRQQLKDFLASYNPDVYDNDIDN